MKTLLPVAATLLAIGLSGCGKSEPRDPLEAAMQAGKEGAAKEEKKQEKTHAADPNPLRRKLSDHEIQKLFFGPDLLDGDWLAWMPCSQAHAGMSVHTAAKVYLKRCDALKADLIKKARAAGFSEVSAEHVLDPRLTGAQQP